jgi:small subunit ribosomal protein S20
MPNSKSAEKRLRQNKTHRLRNRSRRSTLRSQIRKVRASVAELTSTREQMESDGKGSDEISAAVQPQLQEIETEYRSAAQKLDGAGVKHLIHKNTAARTKSRLQKLIKNAKSGL